MLHKVVIEIDTDAGALSTLASGHLANLWHVAQTNPAAYGDRDASQLVKSLGDEIVRRWLAEVPADRFVHQAEDQYRNRLAKLHHLESAR